MILSFRLAGGTAPQTCPASFFFPGSPVHGGRPSNPGLRRIPLVPLAGGDGGAPPPRRQSLISILRGMLQKISGSPSVMAIDSVVS